MGIEQQHNTDYNIPGITKGGAEPKPMPPVEPTEQPIKKAVPIIETYAGDMAQAIGADEGAAIKQVLAEEKKREIEEAATSPRSPQNKLYIMVGIGLVIAALIFIIISVVHSSKPQTVPVTPTQTHAVIYTETNKEINITNLSKEKIAAAILKEKTTAAIAPETVENIFFTKTIGESAQVLSTAKFFESIESTISPALLRSLGSNFMLGVYNLEDARNSVKTTQNPDKHFFIILPVTSRDSAVYGIGTWETTMLDDLFLLWGIDVSGTHAALFHTEWKDEIVKNLNARTLRDTDGSIILLYTFTNDGSVIITDNADTLEEILNRLRAQKVDSSTPLPN